MRAVAAQAKCHRREAFALSEVDRRGAVGEETPSASNQSGDAALHRDAHLLMQTEDVDAALARVCTWSCCGEPTEDRSVQTEPF